MSHTVRVYREFEFNVIVQRQGVSYVFSKMHAMVEALGGTWVEDGPHHGVLGGLVHFDRIFVFTSREDASLAEMLLGTTKPVIKKEQAFTVFWRDGKREVFPGETIADAFNKAGYSVGALGAMDFYSKGDDQSFEWNKDDRTWKPKEGHKQPIGLVMQDLDSHPHAELLGMPTRILGTPEDKAGDSLDDGLQPEMSPMPVLSTLTIFRAAHINGPGCGMVQLSTLVTIEDVVCEYNIKARELNLPVIVAEEASLSTEVIKTLGLYHISFKGSTKKCKLWVAKAPG